MEVLFLGKITYATLHNKTYILLNYHTQKEVHKPNDVEIQCFYTVLLSGEIMFNFTKKSRFDTMFFALTPCYLDFFL